MLAEVLEVLSDRLASYDEQADVEENEWISHAEALNEIFTAIDELEKTEVKLKRSVQWREIFAWIVAAGTLAGVLQAIYSDGLTHVSVFIEAYDPARHRREMLMAMGATRTLLRRHGASWVTVIGDVPVATLRAFAAGLEPRR